jgi:hypothetical protein
MLFEINLALGFISVVLSFILLALFFKIYRMQQSLYLLGMPVGFLFLTLSYLFLLIHFFYPYIAIFSTSVMWIRVITQTWGFTLIAASYYLSKKNTKLTKFSFFDLSALSIVLVIFIFGFMLLTSPAMILDSVYVDNGYFTIANLALLTYIFLFLLKHLETSTNIVKGMVVAPLVFALLWLGQFCFLIWDIDKSSFALVGSQIARVLGFAVLIWIYYLVIKESRSIDE